MTADIFEGQHATITTGQGARVDTLHPDTEDIHIHDIAYALAHLNRWNGHSREPISVAQHSVLVSRVLKDAGHSIDLQMIGLLHDAAEAYTGDLASPLKPFCPGFKEIEHRMEAAIQKRFGLPQGNSDAVKAADIEVGRWEYRDLMSGDKEEEPHLEHPLLDVWGPSKSEYEFLQLYFDLVLQINARFEGDQA